MRMNVDVEKWRQAKEAKDVMKIASLASHFL